MSGISVKPENLTKDRLRSDLEKFGIDVPSSNARKEVLVQLYRTHLLSKQNSEFSSDEDVLDKAASQKKGKPGSPRKSMSKKGSDTANVEGLSDAQLTNQLRELGVDVGPILDSTRRIYQKKLVKLLSERVKAEPASASKEGSQDSHDTLILESDPELEGKTSSIWASKRPSRSTASVSKNWATQDTRILHEHDHNGHEFSDSDVDVKPNVTDKKRSSYRKSTTTTSTYKTEVKDTGRRKQTEPSVSDWSNYVEPSSEHRTTYISYEEQMDPDSPGRPGVLSRRHVKTEVSDDAVDGTYGAATHQTKASRGEKGGMPRWLQILLILGVVVIIFVILNTMEPAKKSGMGALPSSSS